jgi:hypothetical protein
MSESARLEDLVSQYKHQLYGWSRLWTVDSDNVWLKGKQLRLRVEAVQISFNGRGACRILKSFFIGQQRNGVLVSGPAT